MPMAAFPALVAVALAGGVCEPAGAALFQCTGAAGETLFTDAGCPPGYKTVLMVPEAAASAQPPATVAGPASTEAGKVEAAKQAAEAEAARVSAELENARLRSELQQERLRAIDSKLDALLDAQITSQPVYGAVGVVPFGVVPKPFPVCRGNAGQTPWVNCRPGRDDLNKKRFVEQRPNCGITGCTPTTNTCGIAGCTPTILRVPERDSAGRVRMR